MSTLICIVMSSIMLAPVRFEVTDELLTNGGQVFFKRGESSAFTRYENDAGEVVSISKDLKKVSYLFNRKDDSFSVPLVCYSVRSSTLNN